MHRPRPVSFILVLLLSALALGAGNGAQEPAETATTSTPFTMKVQRNEVPVRVVVRDRDGHPVRNLTRDDFRILDNGKPQVITQFTVEGAEPSKANQVQTPAQPGPQAGAAPQPSSVADRFSAFYFDDLVMTIEDVPLVRDAATNYLQNALRPSDRVGIYTASGQGGVEFTSDRERLRDALAGLHPVGLYARSGADCPNLSDYEAYLIDQEHDPTATSIGTQKTINCLCQGDSDPFRCPHPEQRAIQMARQRWIVAQEQAQASLRGLAESVRRVSLLPGQRSVVFVSRGFFFRQELQTLSRIIDRAIRAGVIVNCLDVRGLYTLVPGAESGMQGSGLRGAQAAPLANMVVPNYKTGKLYNSGLHSVVDGELAQIEDHAASENADVMAIMAEGTGGVFFHNNNDLSAGFRTVSGLADYSYLLVFSPGELKENDKYHSLKIELAGTASKFTVQARRGYFVTSGAGSNAMEDALIDAVYSRDELNGPQLRIGTRFFKSSESEANVTIVAHVEAEGLSFHADKERHLNTVTFMTALFDKDGNLVKGVRKSVALHLSDQAFEKVRSSGISVVNNLEISPGSYVIREVVSDDGGVVSTLNGTMEIPY